MRSFCERHAVKRAIVFGSYARGTQTRRSDLDLILIMDTDKRFLDRWDDISDIHEHLPRPHSEVLIYTEQELLDIAHRPFIRQALREGVIVHG